VPGTRKYLPALTVINKIDGVSMETLDQMAREGDGKNVMISCEMDLGLDWLLENIWRVSVADKKNPIDMTQELGLVK
jgi:ribosome-interacting GTPase 1